MNHLITKRLLPLTLPFLVLACEATDTSDAAPPTDITVVDVAADTAGNAAVADCANLGCDDGLSCTIDTCDAIEGLCSWELLPDTCLLGGACVSAGGEHPTDPCLLCAPETDAFAWTGVDGCGLQDPTEPVDGDPCDDEDPCTTEDAWSEGVCTGVSRVCPDEGPCLAGVCDPESDTGCALVPVEGPCDDGDACTAQGQCEEGLCAPGETVSCEDDNPCTIDHCDALAGCVHLPKQSPCCVGTENLCEDGNPCTDDSCDPVTAACAHTPNSAPCDDGDPCTVDDQCAEGGCQGPPKDCDDGNPCTDDYCAPEGGCATVNLDGVACDDLLECSTGDTCEQGVCVADTSECVCELAEPLDAVRFINVALGQGGHPGEALDIDGDPNSCAPMSDCSEGHNNALGLIAAFANEALQDAVDSGDLLLVASFEGADAGAFTLGVYQAEPVDGDCDPMTTSCEMLIDPSSVESGTCAPLIEMPATLTFGLLEAGGPGSFFPFSLPLSAGANLDVVLHNAQIEGVVTQSGGEVTSLNGVVGGAIPKDSLLAAIDSLPEDDLPVDKLLIDAVMAAVEADIDTDGDGIGDASSIGFKVEGVDAIITGYDD